MAKNSKNVLAWFFLSTYQTKMYIINNIKHICRMFTATIFPSFILTAGEDLVSNKRVNWGARWKWGNDDQTLRTIIHSGLHHEEHQRIFADYISPEPSWLSASQYSAQLWASAQKWLQWDSIDTESEQEILPLVLRMLRMLDRRLIGFLSGLGASAVLNLFSISSSVSLSVCWA